jgi:hypothetical protein
MRRGQADERRGRAGGDAHALGRGPPRQVRRLGEHLRKARARFVQLSNAGADDVLDKPFWKEDLAARDVGIHMAPISQVRPSLALCASSARAYADRARAAQYIIMTVLALYHALQAQIVIGQVQKRWGTANGVGGGRMFV